MSSYSSVVLADNPVGYWRLNEASGTVAADLGSGAHPGTYTGTLTHVGDSPIVGDTTARSASLDGSTAYVTIPNDAAFSATLFSVEGWVKRTATGLATQSLIAKGVGPDEWDLFFTNAGNVTFYIGNTVPGAYVQTPGVTAPAVGVWTHFVGTWDGTMIKLYMNGVLVASSATVSGTRSSAGSAAPNIGRRADNNFFAAAEIEEVAYYSYALTAAQVANHYLAGIQSYARGLTYDNVLLADSPLAYYRLSEPAGSATALDLAGTRPGTYTGGVTLGTTGALPGDPATAVTLNGTSGYVALPNASTFGFGNRPSFEAWVNIAAWPSSSIAQLLSTGYNGGSGAGEAFFMRLNTSGGPNQIDWGSNVGTVVHDTPVTVPWTTGTWHHVAGVFDGSSYITYGDGLVIGTRSDSTAPDTSGYQVTPVTLGAWNGMGGGISRFFNGVMQDAALYAHALTPDQIRTHYLAGIVNRNRTAEPAGVVLG